MAIDPLMYQKMSGRKGDPYTRMGEALAKDAKAKSQRDEMPKGAAGGFRVMGLPGMFGQFWFWLKDKSRSK